MPEVKAMQVEFICPLCASQAVLHLIGGQYQYSYEGKCPSCNQYWRLDGEDGHEEEEDIPEEKNIYGERIPERMPIFSGPEERKQVEAERQRFLEKQRKLEEDKLKHSLECPKCCHTGEFITEIGSHKPTFSIKDIDPRDPKHCLSEDLEIEKVTCWQCSYTDSFESFYTPAIQKEE